METDGRVTMNNDMQDSKQHSIQSNLHKAGIDEH